MNIVVLTAALSSLNSGLYWVRGEFTFNVDAGGSAIEIHGEMSRQHVPYAGILARLLWWFTPWSAFLNTRPSRVFLEIVLLFCLVGIIARGRLSWCAKMRLRRDKEGKPQYVSFKPPGAPLPPRQRCCFTKRAGTHGV